MLNDLSVLKTEDVIEGNMLARSNSELALADAENLVTLGESQVQLRFLLLGIVDLQIVTMYFLLIFMDTTEFTPEYFATCPIRNIVSRFGDK